MTAAAQMLVGGVVMLAAGWLLGERFHGMPTMKGWLSVAYLAGFGSIVAFSAYVWLLHNVRPVLAGSYAYVNPAIAVLLGAWFAHERFGASELGAMGVILLGVVAISLAKASLAKAARAKPKAQAAGAAATTPASEGDA
jgi:drug/metabolite transporter (DMT)-like permease